MQALVMLKLGLGKTQLDNSSVIMDLINSIYFKHYVLIIQELFRRNLSFPALK